MTHGHWRLWIQTKKAKKNELRASNQAWFGRYATPVVLLKPNSFNFYRNKL